MDRFGSDGAGFSLDYEPSPSAIRVKGWGFWGADVALAFSRKVREACKNRPAGTTLHLDMTELKPMREEGQAAFTALLESLASLGITNTMISTGSQLTRLQLQRLTGRIAKGTTILFA